MLVEFTALLVVAGTATDAVTAAELLGTAAEAADAVVLALVFGHFLTL